MRIGEELSSHKPQLEVPSDQGLRLSSSLPGFDQDVTESVVPPTLGDEHLPLAPNNETGNGLGCSDETAQELSSRDGNETIVHFHPEVRRIQETKFELIGQGVDQRMMTVLVGNCTEKKIGGGVLDL